MKSLSAQFSEPSHRDYRGMPKDLTTIGYPLEQASDCFAKPLHVVHRCSAMPRSLRFWIESDRLALKLQESNDIDSRVWSTIRFYGRVKKNVDVFAQPSDRNSCLPLCGPNGRCRHTVSISDNSRACWWRTLFECQAIDPIWFDWVSNFFQAPIDVWQGPIAARFGCMGTQSSEPSCVIPPIPNESSTRKQLRNYRPSPTICCSRLASITSEIPM